jgi:hypothetical protein
MVLTLVAGCIIQTRFARRWRALTFDHDRSDLAITLDERGLVTEQSDIERRYSWNALRRIHELPEGVVLEMVDWHAVTLPDQLWAGPEERATFVSGVRASAEQLLADLPTREQMTGAMLLLLLGAGALALQLMIMTGEAIRHAGLDDCSCTYRHSFQGQLFGIAPCRASSARSQMASFGGIDRRSFHHRVRGEPSHSVAGANISVLQLANALMIISQCRTSSYMARTGMRSSRPWARSSSGEMPQLPSTS